MTRPIFTIFDFTRQSNEIEGIYDEARHEAHAKFLTAFLSLPNVELRDVESFVNRVAGASLRREIGDVVYVGGRECPAGGPDLIGRLKTLIDRVNYNRIEPVFAHQAYEYLHPFNDGNGRSGRALWLWQMRRYYQFGEGKTIPLLFLQAYYYQTLSAVLRDTRGVPLGM